MVLPLSTSPTTRTRIVVSGSKLLFLNMLISMLWVPFFIYLRSHLGTNEAPLPAEGSARALALAENKCNKNEGTAVSEKETSEKQHIIFSTSCSPFQNWQSYAFFYSCHKVKQPGTVTRIVSGCSSSEQAALEKAHREQVNPSLSKNFHLHFAPQVELPSNSTTETTKYFNKPFGVRHWMETILGYASSDQSNLAHQDDIIFLLDPDMILTRPLINSFSSDGLWIPTNTSTQPLKVTHGSPFGQRYGYGNEWLQKVRENLTHVVGSHSPVYQVTMKEADEQYCMGPPYIATARDMHKLAVEWTIRTPKVHDVFHNFMAEMFGYSTAAAHLKLPHTVFRELMISDAIANCEGGTYLDTLSRQDVCHPKAIAMDQLPPVVHYCQRYALGRWFFGKYKLPTDFFSCESPLLREPPRDLAVTYDYYIYPNGERKEFREDERSIKRSGFLTCHMIDAMNEVASYYKSQHCPDGNANWKKTYIFHEAAVKNESLLYAIEKAKTK